MANANVMDVGKKLAELCRQGKNLEAVNSLYAKNVVSNEAMSDGSMPQRMEGIDAIRGKNEWWLNNHDIHGQEIKGPFPNGDRFIVYMTIDATAKVGPMAGKRMKFDEAGLYTVKEGKIVEEEFFYHMA